MVIGGRPHPGVRSPERRSCAITFSVSRPAHGRRRRDPRSHRPAGMQFRAAGCCARGRKTRRRCREMARDTRETRVERIAQVTQQLTLASRPLEEGAHGRRRLDDRGSMHGRGIVLRFSAFDARVRGVTVGFIDYTALRCCARLPSMATILIVDDHRGTRLGLAEMLGDAGYTVVTTVHSRKRAICCATIPRTCSLPTCSWDPSTACSSSSAGSTGFPPS